MNHEPPFLFPGQDLQALEQHRLDAAKRELAACADDDERNALVRQRLSEAQEAAAALTSLSTDDLLGEPLKTRFALLRLERFCQDCRSLIKVAEAQRDAA